MNFIIRQAKGTDINAILSIINYEILNTTAVYDYKERSLEEQKKWYEEKTANNMPILVAEINGTVVAYGTYGIFRPWEAYKFSVEHSVYVSKKEQGKGIGKQILKQLIITAKKQGFHTMIAGIDASNKKSIDFHKKFGFKEIGIVHEIGFKFGKWLDLSFLQLFINNR